MQLINATPREIFNFTQQLCHGDFATMKVRREKDLSTKCTQTFVERTKESGKRG